MASSSPRNSLGNVRSDMDIPYPEHLSRLNRHLIVEYPKSQNRSKRNNRPRTRYRTQPVTFDEIQEVDEENSVPDNPSFDDAPASLPASKFNIEICAFPNILGSKRRFPKSKLGDTEKSTGDKERYDNNNDELMVQQKSIDQLKRIDRSRETSI
ncbi:uncharacterized protein [Parasteatoda tepidariorum]|nr:uncharacterized protein LOC107443974 [Parasteatoda tepidariorum]